MLLIISVALGGTLCRIKFPPASVVVPCSLFLIVTETPGSAFPALSVILPLMVVSAKLIRLLSGFFKGLPAEAENELVIKMMEINRICILSMFRYIGQPLIE